MLQNHAKDSCNTNNGYLILFKTKLQLQMSVLSDFKSGAKAVINRQRSV